MKEAENALRETLKDARSAQVETLLSGEADGNDCYVEIHSRAAAGGTESRSGQHAVGAGTPAAERRKFKIEAAEMHDGEEAGIKSATKSRWTWTQRLWLAEDRERRAPAGAYFAL